jgi:hypothetical protein
MVGCGEGFDVCVLETRYEGEGGLSGTSGLASNPANRQIA